MVIQHYGTSILHIFASIGFICKTSLYEIISCGSFEDLRFHHGLILKGEIILVKLFISSISFIIASLGLLCLGIQSWLTIK